MTAGQEKEEVTLRVLGTEEMGGHMTGSLSVEVVTEVGWTGTEAQTPETGAQTPEIAGNTDQTDAGQVPQDHHLEMPKKGDPVHGDLEVPSGETGHGSRTAAHRMTC